MNQLSFGSAGLQHVSTGSREGEDAPAWKAELRAQTEDWATGDAGAIGAGAWVGASHTHLGTSSAPPPDGQVCAHFLSGPRRSGEQQTHGQLPNAGRCW